MTSISYAAAVSSLVLAMGVTLRRAVDAIAARAGVVSLVTAVVLFLFYYLTSRPPTLYPPSGWYTWFDAGQTLQSALAFASGNLAPDRHWYPPGYALLGTLSFLLLPIDPFLVPNLGSLILAHLLFFRIAGGLGLGRVPAAVGFLLGTVAVPDLAMVWVQPWSTTPATVLALGATAAAMSVLRSRKVSACFVTAFCAGLIATMRPTDGLIVLATTGSVAGGAILATRSPARIAAAAAAGVAGFLLPVAAAVAVHLAIFGPVMSPYMGLGRAFGFELALTPFRWVSVVLDPSPWFLGDAGLATRMPWLALGIGGAAAALVSAWRVGLAQIAAHFALILPALATLTLYLAFRDINQPYLWLHWNVHYFKLPLLVLAFYALFLLKEILRPRAGPLVAAAVAAVAATFWRIELAPYAQLVQEPPAVDGVRMIALPPGLDHLSTVYHVTLEGWAPERVPLIALKLENIGALAPGERILGEVIADRISLHIDGVRYHHVLDYKPIPIGGRTLMIFPIRRMPAGKAVLHVSGLAEGSAVVVRAFHQHLVFGIPCWLPGWNCGLHQPSPPPIELGQTYYFNQPAVREFLRSGFSFMENWGSWTNGKAAVLEAHVGVTGSPLRISVTAQPFLAPGSPGPKRVHVHAGGKLVKVLEIIPGVEIYQFDVPGEATEPNGILRIEFRILDPIVPLDRWISIDRRSLGIGLRSIEIREIP